MPKKLKNGSSFVTQSQWVEGMEMIKDFFEKLLTRQNSSDIKMANFETELTSFRQEQREHNERLEKKIDMNSDSISQLSKELRAAEKMEFAIYNHPAFAKATAGK